MPESRRLVKVLVAIDGSEASMRAADFALSIAAKSGAELTLLHVFYSQLAYAYTSYLSKVEDSSSIDAILHSAEDKANHWFNSIKNKLKNTYAYTQNIKIESDVIITSTSISRAIIGYAEHNMINLIIIGTKRRSAVKKVFLGSITSEMLKYSQCPVLVIK
jgi:nucleotide-binding universal stress UspA family protein